MSNASDFFQDYFSYTEDTECPKFFHRWCAITGIGAMLGRNYFFRHGHFVVNPNVYCKLIGEPGTRKSTAIKMMKSLLGEAGYNTIAADKTTKEKFLVDLSGCEEEAEGADVLDKNLWGDDDANENSQPREMLIAADEFNDFMGINNMEFISLLGNLWDYSGVYRNRIKNGKSVSIPNPTISILGGNTATNFATAFPVEIFGQGFFSRLILVHGEDSGKRIAFPPVPDAKLKQALAARLIEIKTKVYGEATLTEGARRLMEKIYVQPRQLDDPRFSSYYNRRFTHLIKLCLIVSASRLSNVIDVCDVVYANTILSHTEHLMPKALGEFGKSKNSDVSHKIMQILDGATTPYDLKTLWGMLHHDLEKITDLAELLKNLVIAEKIQQTPVGFLQKKKVLVEVSSDTVDYNLLHPLEKGTVV